MFGHIERLFNQRSTRTFVSMQNNLHFFLVLSLKFLKFVEKTAPVAVYTSGKGSSAAGLTASVIQDSSSVSLCTCLCLSHGVLLLLISLFLKYDFFSLTFVFSANFIWKEGLWFWQMEELSA